MKNKTMARPVKSKKAAEYYLSKGATLLKEKDSVWYFDANDTKSMQLEYRYIIK